MEIRGGGIKQSIQAMAELNPTMHLPQMYSRFKAIFWSALNHYILWRAGLMGHALVCLYVLRVPCVWNTE